MVNIILFYTIKHRRAVPTICPCSNSSSCLHSLSWWTGRLFYNFIHLDHKASCMADLTLMLETSITLTPLWESFPFPLYLPAVRVSAKGMRCSTTGHLWPAGVLEHHVLFQMYNCTAFINPFYFSRNLNFYLWNANCGEEERNVSWDANQRK